MKTLRRGSTYIVVLLASLIVATMSLAAIESSRWYARDVVHQADYLRCAMSADTAIEFALARINDDNNWRSNHTNDVDVGPFTLNGVNVSYRLTDEDGDLNNSDLHNCELIVTVSSADSVQAWSASLRPVGDAIECLNYSVVANKKITVNQYSVVSSDQSIATNADIDVQAGGYLTADCSVGLTATGSIYGATTSLSSPIDIPNKDVLDYYIADATEIDIDDLPEVDGQKRIENLLLSASSNPISGDLNAQGLYYLDCKLKDLLIRNCRFACTLVLKKPKNGSVIGQSMHWTAHVSNFPILLVEGEMEFALRSSPLSESDLGVNLNPPGTPYRGVEDGTTSTVYPSLLQGLIYTSKKIELKDIFGEQVIYGQIITDSEIKTTGDLRIQSRDIYRLNPPPGFSSGSGVRVINGSLRRIATP